MNISIRSTLCLVQKELLTSKLKIDKIYLIFNSHRSPCFAFNHKRLLSPKHAVGDQIHEYSQDLQMMMNNQVHSLRQLESIFSSKLCSKIIRNSAQAFYFPFFVPSISFLLDSEAFCLKHLLFFLKFVRLDE